MKIARWTIILSVSLAALSALIFVIKYLVIGDSGTSNTLTYIFNALGFLPLNVLFVTLLLNSMLSHRAAIERQEKMKMVLGLFFTEFGSELLREFVASDPTADELRKHLGAQKSWKKEDYAAALKAADELCKKTMPDSEALCRIRALLSKNHDFMLQMIQNPVLLEQNVMSSLMRDLFHLETELSSRCVICADNRSDVAHLRGDVNRIYPNLVKVWLTHMEYLSKNYPYLLSYSLRTSPFLEKDDVVVRE